MSQSSKPTFLIREYSSRVAAEVDLARLRAAGYDAEIGSPAYPAGFLGGSIWGARILGAEEDAEAMVAALDRAAPESYRELGAVAEEPGFGEEETDLPSISDPSHGTAEMKRAAAGAFFGALMCPLLSLYATWVLLTNASKPMTAKGRTFRGVAVGFLLLTLLLYGTILVRL